MTSSPPEQDQGGALEAPYRELTFAAVFIGVLIGAIMTSAFVYIALKLGFSLGGSTVAAILGFGILRQVVRETSIVESNINQTIARIPKESRAHH